MQVEKSTFTSVNHKWLHTKRIVNPHSKIPDRVYRGMYLCVTNPQRTNTNFSKLSISTYQSKLSFIIIDK